MSMSEEEHKRSRAELRIEWDRLAAESGLNEVDSKMPLVWSDDQGREICVALRHDFPDHQFGNFGLAFNEHGKWVCGSCIEIFGASNPDVIHRIAETVGNILKSNKFTTVRLDFYEGMNSKIGGAAPKFSIQVAGDV